MNTEGVSRSVENVTIVQVKDEGRRTGTGQEAEVKGEVNVQQYGEKGQAGRSGIRHEGEMGILEQGERDGSRGILAGIETQPERDEANSTSFSLGKDDVTEVIGGGITSVLGPLVRNFEETVNGVLQSQSALENTLQRLTRELDKLLEDTPLPLGAQHAARLSVIRKRVGSLTVTLRIIQERIYKMQDMISDQSLGPLC